MTKNIFANDFTAIKTGLVTQGAADYCAEHGHAKYTINRVDQGYCPRCLKKN